MPIVWLIAFMVASALVGAWMVAVAQRPFDTAPSVVRTGPVLLLGDGGVGWVTMMLRLMGGQLGRWGLIAVAAAALAVCLSAGVHRSLQISFLHLDQDRAEWRRPEVWLSVAILAAAHAVVIVHAIGFPMQEWDAVAIWGFKAKILAHSGTRPLESVLTDVSLSFSHLNYPLLVPAMITAAYDLLGQVKSCGAGLCMPVLFLGMSLTLAGFCRRRIPLSQALAVTALVAASPVVVRWAGSGNADLPLAAFYPLALISFVEWQTTSDRSWCMIGGLAAGFSALTKQEGMPLAFAGMLVLVVLAWTEHRRSPNALFSPVLAAGVAALLVVPWLTWAHVIPHTHENYLAHLTPSECLQNLPRLPIIGRAFLAQALDPRRSGPVWLVLAFVAVLHRRRTRRRAVLGAGLCWRCRSVFTLWRF